MLNSFMSIMPIFMLILAGNLLKKYFISDENFWKQAEKLTYYVLFPCLLILKLSKVSFASNDSGSAIFAVTVITFFIGSITFVFKNFFKIEAPLFYFNFPR